MKASREAAKVAAYIRVSTQEQAIVGQSLETQINRIQAFCVATERTNPKVFKDDGYSAATLRRPAMRQLLSDVKNRLIDVVVVTKLDRLTRSLDDLLSLIRLLEKYGVALVSTSEAIDTESAAGKMLLHLLGVFAEFERARIGERTKDVLADRRINRKPYSRKIPFGFTLANGQLIEQPAQISALRTALILRSQGHSFRAIGDFFTSCGFHPRTGHKWHPQVIKDILASRMAVEIAQKAD